MLLFVCLFHLSLAKVTLGMDTPLKDAPGALMVLEDAAPSLKSPQKPFEQQRVRCQDSHVASYVYSVGVESFNRPPEA